MKIVDRRKEEAQSTLDEAQQHKEKAQEREKKADQALEELEETRDQQLEEAREQAKKQRDQIVADAQTRARELEEAAQQDAERAREAARHDVQSQATSVALELASKLLREAGRQPRAFLETLSDHIDKLSDQDKRSIRQAARKDPTVRVFFDSEIDEDIQNAWRDRLRELVSPDVDVQFATDDSLIVGARVELPGGARLSYSWHDILEQTESELRDDAVA
jgi:F-type H+-transporting ATPase subunit b